MRGAVSCALLIALAAGCESPVAAPVPRGAEKPRLYSSLVVGTEWEYAQPNGKRAFRRKLISVEEREGSYQFTLATIGQTPAPGEEPSFDRYAVSERGLFVCEMDLESPTERIVFDEPKCLLKLPYKRGEKWIGRADEPRVTGGIEKIKVPAGEFECIRVDGDGNSYWYAPGVGLVKSGTGNLASELISFSVPKN